MTRAVARLAVPPTLALIDGNIVPASLTCRARAVVDGDALSLSIAAASILAKVMRDRLMTRLALRYPAYGWERNAGYGTPEHQAGIVAAGPTRHHRLTFAPFRNITQ
jgi:ribonuclease HII